MRVASLWRCGPRTSRFTTDEAQVFLNDVMGLQLQPAVVAALEARTEGGRPDCNWPLCRSGPMPGPPTCWEEVAGFVEAFSGTHRFVLDYLVEEVLDRQSDEVRAFLLETSVLDQLTGGLCDAVTGRSDGQPMLETLERENLFLVPLDDERRWYYHQLSLTHCVPKLSVRHGDRVNALHAAASQWLAENGLLADAVRHAIASGDYEPPADLVELAEADLRRRRHDRTLRDWLVALPHDVTRRRPLLATFMGWSRLSEGDIDGVERGSTPPMPLSPRRRRQRSPRRPHSPRRPETENRRSGLSRP